MADAISPIGQFQQAYLKRCIDAEAPLNSIQVSALEATVAQFFGLGVQVSHPNYPNPLASQPIDKTVLDLAGQKVGFSKPQSLMAAIDTYNRMHDTNYTPDRVQTDADALALYQDSIKLLAASDRKDPFISCSAGCRPLKNNLPDRFYTMSLFKVLEAYLLEQKIIPEAYSQNAVEGLHALNEVVDQIKYKGISVNGMGFSTRVKSGLSDSSSDGFREYKRIETLGQLLELTPDKLRQRRNFGKGCLKEVQLKLAELGLHLKEDTLLQS